MTLPFWVTPERDTTCVTLPSVDSACTATLVPSSLPPTIVAPTDMGVALLDTVGGATPVNVAPVCPFPLLYPSERFKP